MTDKPEIEATEQDEIVCHETESLTAYVEIDAATGEPVIMRTIETRATWASLVPQLQAAGLSAHSIERIVARLYEQALATV